LQYSHLLFESNEQWPVGTLGGRLWHRSTHSKHVQGHLSSAQWAGRQKVNLADGKRLIFADESTGPFPTLIVAVAT
jgi:hypothetical protein